MTAQANEQLLYKGNTYGMNTEPLSGYLVPGEPGAFGPRPEFLPRNSGCWRGYVGRWAIEDGRLYMTGIEGYFADGGEVTLATLFPDAPQPVFAKWFWGVLEVNDGKLLRYVHMGYLSVYERTILIEIRGGLVTAETVRRNRWLSPEDWKSITRDPTLEEWEGLFGTARGGRKSKSKRPRKPRSFLDT